MVEGEVDHAVGGLRLAPQALQVLQRSLDHLGPGGRQSGGLCRVAAQAAHLVSGADEFAHHRRAHPTRRARHEYTHLDCSEMLMDAFWDGEL